MINYYSWKVCPHHYFEVCWYLFCWVYRHLFFVWYTEIFIICWNMIIYCIIIEELIGYCDKRNINRNWWLIIILGRYIHIINLRYVDIYFVGYIDIFFVVGIPKSLLFVEIDLLLYHYWRIDRIFFCRNFNMDWWLVIILGRYVHIFTLR